MADRAPGRALDSGARPGRGEASRLIKRGILPICSAWCSRRWGRRTLVLCPSGVPADARHRHRWPGVAENPAITCWRCSVLSNTQVLFAHLIGLLFSLWLLQRIYSTR